MTAAAQVWREHGLRYGHKQQQQQQRRALHSCPRRIAAGSQENEAWRHQKHPWSVRSMWNKARLAAGGHMDTVQVSLGSQRGCCRPAVTFGTRGEGLKYPAWGILSPPVAQGFSSCPFDIVPLFFPDFCLYLSLQTFSKSSLPKEVLEASPALALFLWNP